MYTHRITVDLPLYGNCVLFFEYTGRRLPSKGKDRSYCPSLKQVIEFDFSDILESQIVSAELV